MIEWKVRDNNQMRVLLLTANTQKGQVVIKRKVSVQQKDRNIAKCDNLKLKVF